eukprot:4097250-Lingulodinium_polyedra.AAC.1
MCMLLSPHARANERASERTNEQASGRTSKRTNAMQSVVVCNTLCQVAFHPLAETEYYVCKRTSCHNAFTTTRKLAYALPVPNSH